MSRILVFFEASGVKGAKESSYHLYPLSPEESKERSCCAKVQDNEERQKRGALLVYVPAKKRGQDHTVS
jgi:hypothetical protein